MTKKTTTDLFTLVLKAHGKFADKIAVINA